MAKQQGGGLNFKTKVDIAESKARLLELTKLIKDVGGINMAGGAKAFDSKPLSEYQAGLLKIKQEALELAKQKAEDVAKSREQAAEERRQRQEQVAANRSASLATQAALREEIRIKKEQIAAEKSLIAEQSRARRRPGDIISPTDTNAQVQNSTVRSESIINNERVARAALNTELARQAIAQGTLTTTITSSISATNSSTASQNQNNLSRRELAKLLAEEKYRQAQTTAELKNNAREMLNAKGSIEQRRAALIRLTREYDRLSQSERNSAAGNRMQGVIQRINSQVLDLERATGRSQRNVGNYGGSIINTFTDIGAALGITFSIQALVSFGQELFGIAKKAEGIELAFSKIGGEQELESLRQAVKGTVSDLELMGIAVRADKFKIPMDVLAKGLEFSRQRAIDLGKDVDYMVNSFVNGIGRKSKLVMDNLGISASELSVEVKKTGDFATAVGNIMDREMAKGGIAVDTLADKSGRLATIWENLKKSTGNFFNSQKLNTERIAELTKAGNVDLNQSTYTTRIRLITKQGEEMSRLAGERVEKEKEIAALESRYGTGTQVNVEKARLRQIIERQLAEKNIYNSMVGQNFAMNEQHRTSKGLLSLEELRDKAKQKREDADGVVIRGKKDEDEVRRLYKEADALEKQANRFSEKTMKKDTAEKERQVKAQRSLQAEIDALNDKGKRKQLDNDEEEIANVETKYQKLRDKAIAFNNDASNKKKGIKVDSGGLLVGESKELDALRDKQAASKLKTTLDEQKKLYDEYESYKDKVGSARANERYAKLINTDKTYLEELERQKAEITDTQKSKGGSEVDIAASEERLKVLDKEIADELLAQQKKQDELFAEFASYADKRKAMIEKGEKEIATITDAEAKKNRRKILDEDLKELDFANLKKLESYEALFKGIDQLSEKSAMKQLEFARKALDKDILSGAITDPEEIAKIKAYFNEIENTIKEGSGKAIQKLGSAVSDFGSEVEKVNKELGNTISILGNVLGKVGDIKAGFKEFKVAQGKGDGLGQLTAGLGMFGAGISIFKTVFSLFDRSAQREEQAAYARDLQNKQTDAVNKALERQIALVNDAYGTDRFVKYNEAIKQATVDEAKYQDQLKNRYALTGDKTVDKLIEQLNSTGKFANDFLNTDKFTKEFKSKMTLLPTAIADLQRLLDEGKLDAGTAVIAQNLIKAGEAANQLKNQLSSENVGSSLGQIADDFIKTLTDGTQDFGKSFEDTIRTSILNGFKGKLIEQQLQAFYTQFAELSSGGLTAEEIETLRTAYSTAADKAKKDILDLEKATGIDLTGDTSGAKKTGISGGIVGEALKEDTANRMLGLQQGQYDLTKQIGLTMGDMLRIGRSKLVALEKIAANTFRSANNTDRLANIETALTSIDKKTTGSPGTSLDQALRDNGLKI